ncbi:hypothetical protein ACQBAR_04335 [Propionibacteriaceae bacterium Y1685]|uniref:hypothetical protein n=1 Tax=Microlunatus sp. Y1700 TaxID=3418487 RepID=UPI003B79AE0B
MRVDPAEVSACASGIRDRAAAWLAKERDTLAEADGLAGLGTDRVGRALFDAIGPLTPPAGDYVRATGHCTSETGVLLHDVAYAYSMTFRNAEKSARQVSDLLVRLGAI